MTRLAGVYWMPHRDTLPFQFVCTVTDGELAPTEESDDFSFCSVEDLPAKLSPTQRERVHDVLSLSHDPVFAIQTSPSARDLIRDGLL